MSFPTCWNGRDLDSADHRSHVAYFDSSGRCPSGYPAELPELVLFRTFTQYEGLLDDTSLSSGATGGLHADFVSGWNEAALSDLINSCRSRNCSRVGEQVPASRLTAADASTSKAAALPSSELSERFFCRLFHG